MSCVATPSRTWTFDAKVLARIRRKSVGPLLLLPILFFLALLFAFPLLRLLGLSIVDSQGALSSLHYAKLLSTTTYVEVLGITFEIAGLTTLFSLLAGYPIAYLLATSTQRTRSNLVLWVLVPFWTSFLVRTFAWIVLLGRNGAINGWLQQLGVTDAPLSMIYNLMGVLIGMVHALMPLAVLTMLSVMQGIDSTLSRAAMTLGARGGQTFFRIYFPLSLPGVAAAGLLVFITSLGFFITPALLGGRTDTMISQLIIEQVLSVLNWGFAGAIGLLLLGATLCVFFLYDRVLGVSSLTGETDIRRGHLRTHWWNIVGEKIAASLLRTVCWVCDRFGEFWDMIRPIPHDRPRRRLSRYVLWSVASFGILFLALPSLFVIPVSFTESSFLEWPPRGFTLNWYERLLESELWLGAMIRSVAIALATAILSTVIGVPAAFAIARHRFAGRIVLLAFILSPMIVPRILLAVALFYLYARLGLVGTSSGLVLGHTIVALPYVVISVMAVLKSYDTRLDSAARIMGATAWQTLWRVTLPLIRPGLIAGFLFAFVVSFDELTIALFVTGGIVTTLPKQMWDDAILNVGPIITAASTIVLVFVTATIVLAESLRRRSVPAQ